MLTKKEMKDNVVKASSRVINSKSYQDGKTIIKQFLLALAVVVLLSSYTAEPEVDAKEDSQQQILAISEVVEPQSDIKAMELFVEAEKEALRIKNENIMIEKINNYIKKYQRGESGMNGDNVLAISREYNIAIDLILTMAHKESHFGTNGRAVATNNPFNVGNTDCGDGRAATNDGCSNFLKTTEDGMRLWARYVTQCYFDGGKATLDGMFAIDFKVQYAHEGLCGAGTIGKAYMSGCNNKSICEAIKGGYRELRVLVNQFGIENNALLE